MTVYANPFELSYIRAKEKSPYNPIEINDSCLYSGTEKNINYINTVIIPYWIEDQAARNKINIADILHYDVLSKIASISDIARLLACQNISLQPYITDRYYDPFVSLIIPDNQKNYFNDIILPLSLAQNIIDDVTHMLSDDDTDDVSSDDGSSLINDDGSAKLYHELRIVGSDLIFCIIKKGFLSAIKDREYAMRYISDTLKMHYSFLPIMSVSYTSIFRDYVELL